MKLRLLRNATLKLEIRGRIVLIDPFFAPKGSRPSFTGRRFGNSRPLSLPAWVPFLVPGWLCRASCGFMTHFCRTFCPAEGARRNSVPAAGRSRS